MNAQLVLVKGEPASDFMQFWNCYPRRVGKVPAARLWKRTQPNLEEVLAGVAAWKSSREWSDPMFIPHPTTFLARQQWQERPITKANVKISMYNAMNDAPLSETTIQKLQARAAAALKEAFDKERA